MQMIAVIFATALFEGMPTVAAGAILKALAQASKSASCPDSRDQTPMVPIVEGCRC
jgi:hypothetical protein